MALHQGKEHKERLTTVGADEKWSERKTDKASQLVAKGYTHSALGAVSSDDVGFTIAHAHRLITVLRSTVIARTR